MSTESPVWRIKWHAKDFLLTGVALIRAEKKESAIGLLRKLTMIRHDMVIVIDECKATVASLRVGRPD